MNKDDLIIILKKEQIEYRDLFLPSVFFYNSITDDTMRIYFASSNF